MNYVVFSASQKTTANPLQAVGRLTTILELLRSFTADYIRQTNLLLGEPTAEGAHGDLLANFESAAAQLMGHPVGDLAPPVEEKKERKKRTHDPNAPKRPLTPYFLYMQHARSIIANDLGPEAPKGAVQEEGQRRWASMNPDEKSVRWPSCVANNCLSSPANVSVGLEPRLPVQPSPVQRQSPLLQERQCRCQEHDRRGGPALRRR